MTKGRISYFMAEGIGGFFYGDGHVMQPHRLSITHNLNLAYGLYRKMNVYRPRKANPEELISFHAVDYVDFLSKITPDNALHYSAAMDRYKFDGDCPVFDGMFEFCQLYTGGSIDGAKRLMSGHSDIAINWAGGLHHAKKGNASGFCYVNDIVLSILELLKYYTRVLYIDIDVHHGDGVEEAFYVTDRVMTVSFHKHEKNFFPESGSIFDTGVGLGEYYSVNVPLKGGIDDDTYREIFNPVIAKVMEMYRPAAVVLQCGADSLAKDVVGDFNLTIKGHGQAVQFVKSFGIPTLVLGGGGYNIRSVARCWAYETSLLLDHNISNDIPDNDYWNYFAPDYKLHFEKIHARPDRNSKTYIDKVRHKVLENLRKLEHAPSVPMQHVPPVIFDQNNNSNPNDHAQVDGEFYNHNRDQGMENSN